MTACAASGQDQRDGTSDDESVNTGTNEESDESQDNLPGNSDPSGANEQNSGGDDDQDGG